MDLEPLILESVTTLLLFFMKCKTASAEYKVIEDYCNDVAGKYARIYGWAGWVSEENPSVLPE